MKPTTVGLWTWSFEHFTIQKNCTEKIKVHRHEEALYNPIQSYTILYNLIHIYFPICSMIPSYSIHSLLVGLHPHTPDDAMHSTLAPGERSSMASALVSIQPRRRPGGFHGPHGPRSRERTPGPGFMVDICRYGFGPENSVYSQL